MIRRLTSAANFVVTLTQTTAIPVTVTYVANSGSAISGLDFTATSGTLTIPANQLTGTISVGTIIDGIDEVVTEIFTLDLGSANVGITDAQGVGEINDVDSPPTISINSISIPEGSTGNFTVSLTGLSAFTVTVNYTTVADGTATAAPGDAAEPDVTITNNYETAMAVSKGETNTQMAFMTGKIKVSGNMAKLMMNQAMLGQFAAATSGMKVEY